MTGFHVSEDDEFLVLREPAAGKEIELYKEDLVAQKMDELSAMPLGLANQLPSRDGFLDLVRFLMEVNELGPERQAELKQQVTGR